jgi:hypothetical protein
VTGTLMVALYIPLKRAIGDENESDGEGAGASGALLAGASSAEPGARVA